MSKKGIVYLLKENGDESMYKIGVTKSVVSERIKKLQTGNGNEIICVAEFETDKPFKLEKMLHFQFSQSREDGEWFLLSKEDAESFIPLCEKFQRTIDSLDSNPFF